VDTPFSNSTKQSLIQCGSDLGKLRQNHQARKGCQFEKGCFEQSRPGAAVDVRLRGKISAIVVTTEINPQQSQGVQHKRRTSGIGTW